MDPEARHRRSEQRRHSSEARDVCGASPRGRDGRLRVPVPDAAHSDRRLPRHRVRPPQRVFRAAAADAAGLLSGPSHGRPDVARDERPQRRPDDGGSGGDVLVEHAAGVRRGAHPDELDRRAADADGTPAASARLDQRKVLRQRDSHPLRSHPGPALRHQCRGPGSVVRSPRSARLQSGAPRACALPRRECGVRAPQSRADSPPGHVLSEHDLLPRAGIASGPVVGQPGSHQGPDHARRFRGLQRLSGHALMADDCVRLGHQHPSAGDGFLEAHERSPRRRS